MKKEPIIAITLGVVFGVLVGVGVLYAMNPPSGETVADQDSSEQDVAVQDRETIEFELSQPEDEITVRSDRISIQGTATVDSLIITQSALSEEIVRTESDTFEYEFPLAVGENVITMTFYPKTSPSDYIERTLRVYYLPE